MPPRPIPLVFPFKGLHESSALVDQPDGTSPNALNVRGYDQRFQKDRGGQRPGLVRVQDPLEDAQVDGLYQMTQVVTADNSKPLFIPIGTIDLTDTGGYNFNTGTYTEVSARIDMEMQFDTNHNHYYAVAFQFNDGGTAVILFRCFTPGDGTSWIHSLTVATGWSGFSGVDPIALAGSPTVTSSFDATMGVALPGTSVFHLTIIITDDGTVTFTSADLAGANADMGSLTGNTSGINSVSIANTVGSHAGTAIAYQSNQLTQGTLAPAYLNRNWIPVGTIAVSPTSTSASIDGINDLAVSFNATILLTKSTDVVTITLTPDTPTIDGNSIVISIKATPSSGQAFFHVDTPPIGSYDQDFNGMTGAPIGKPFSLTITLRQGEFYVYSNSFTGTHNGFHASLNAFPYDWIGSGPQTVTLGGTFAKTNGMMSVDVLQTQHSEGGYPLVLPFVTDGDGDHTGVAASVAGRSYNQLGHMMAGPVNHTANTAIMETETFAMQDQFKVTLTGYFLKNGASGDQPAFIMLQVPDDTALVVAGTIQFQVFFQPPTTGNHGQLIFNTVSGAAQTYNIPVSWAYGAFTLVMALDGTGALTVTWNGTVIGTDAAAGLLPVGRYSMQFFQTNTNGRFSSLEVLTSAPSYASTIETVLLCTGGDCYLSTEGGPYTLVDTTPIGSGPAYQTGGEMCAVAAGGFYWIVDGTNNVTRIDGATGVIDRPSADAGTMPQKARLITLFRDRLWFLRFVDDPFNYVVSKSGDFLDFDASDTSPVGAFAGNNAEQAGLLGEPITAVAPFGDTSMIIGMPNGIAVVRGDPKAGGSIDYLSREVGISQPGAWARDPSGTFLFMSRDGLYQIDGAATNRLDLQGGVASANPTPMSRGRMDVTLGAVNSATTKILMSWDPLELGLKIFLLPTRATQPTEVVFWEKRKDAFWIDSYPPGIGPTAVASLTGSGGSDLRVLLGGWDGALRRVDATADDDDGSLITSLVQYTPVQLIDPLNNAKVVQMRNLWGDGGLGGFNATYNIRMGTDADAAVLAPVQNTRTITVAGYQGLDHGRSRGACLVLEITNNVQGTRWQIERATAVVDASGRIRQ